MPNAFLLVCCAVLLPSCSALPSFGPTADDIVSSAQHRDEETSSIMSFDLVIVSAEVLNKSGMNAYGGYSAALRSQNLERPYIPVSAGDVVQVRIWEAAEDGLFSSTSQSREEFGLVVSNKGEIEAPYVGPVSVVGLSTARIRQILLDRYSGLAVEPDIQVTVSKTSAQSASILGDDLKSGRFAIPARGIRLLDFLAMAGGSPNPAWETYVSLIRNGQTETVRLDRIYANIDNNVVILPDDILRLSIEPRSFAVYGAVSKAGSTTIAREHVTLSNILAKTGGLNDMTAEPNSVFVFRFVGQSNGSAASSSVSSGDRPTVFQLDFSRPDAFFLAESFEIKENDIVYVATADASELRKFITTIVSPVLSSVVGLDRLGG